MSKAQVVSELWEFMKQNKKYWLAPIIITLVLFGVLLVLAKSSALAPFIYTIF
jgi:drug/metabolite transporter superfamily protein YnfA